MNDTNKVYKILIVVFAIALALQLLLVWNVFLPRKEELDSVRGDVQMIFEKLRGSKWPMDAERLEKYISQLQQEIDGGGKTALVKNTHLSMERCQVTFRDKIKKEYGNVQDFMRRASRMDYQAEYNRIIDDFKKKGIVLEPSAMNLSEEVATQYIYQPIMQLWTLEKLLSLAQDAGLEIETAKRGGNPALVSVKPMKAYFKTSGADRPYLLEFPVEVTVVGGIKECLSFIESLNSDSVFLPPVFFEIFALPPSVKTGESSGKLKMHLVCSSFLAGERGL